MSDGPAFGGPGIAPTWTSSAKDLVTTALGAGRVWATLGYGIVNEVYWPATGEPQIRDLGFILANDAGWIELKRARNYTVGMPSRSVPLPRVTHDGPDYQFTFELVVDPDRDVLIISYELTGPYRVYALLAPHLAGSGLNNTAWIDGQHVCAQSGARALTLTTSPPLTRASAGYVGSSDGWQDFDQHGRMTYEFDRAESGNVAVIAELASSHGTIALGFSEEPSGARVLAAESLAEGFDAIRARFVAGWEDWSRTLALPAPTAAVADAAGLSAAVLKVHEDRTFPGAIVASLSIPWGNSSDSRGGYHLVWTRDAAEAALALVVIGKTDDALRTVAYFASTQLDDGHWHQNFYPDGTPFWDAVQLDETAFPILLAARLDEGGTPLTDAVVRMTQRAAAFIAQVGPMSPQDRWEENSGANPFTLAVEIAALVASAGHLDPVDAAYALSLADYWNERIEDWCYVQGTPLADRVGVRGYYVRVAPPARSGRPDRIELHNRSGETMASSELIGLEFIYLARLGLRAADDPRIADSLRVADAVLRVETPSGPLYHRYNDDGYGEHEDGQPFDGSGIGRAWPLLTGERGHLALMLGEDPLPYLETMLNTAGPCGLLPEQAWDVEAIPRRFLYPGRPTGSAMPLVWAHAEFLTLLIARERGVPCERLASLDARYAGRRPEAATWHWRSDAPFSALPAGRHLLIEHVQPFVLHMGVDGWQRLEDVEAKPLGLGLYGVRLGADVLAAAQAGTRALNFTRRFADGWEGTDYEVALAPLNQS